MGQAQAGYHLESLQQAAAFSLWSSTLQSVTWAGATSSLECNQYHPRKAALLKEMPDDI